MRNKHSLSQIIKAIPARRLLSIFVGILIALGSFAIQAAAQEKPELSEAETLLRREMRGAKDSGLQVAVVRDGKSFCSNPSAR